MHRAGQRCFELVEVEVETVEVDMASQESTMKDVKILHLR